MRRRGFLKHQKIRTKIIVICVSILLLNSIVCGVLYYDYAGKDTLENFQSSSMDIMFQVNQYFSDRITAITSRVHALCNNQIFSSQLISYLDQPSDVEYAKVAGSISSAMREIAEGDRYIHSLLIYTDHGVFEEFTRNKNPDFDFKESRYYQPFAEDENRTICWFEAGATEIFRGSDTVIPVVWKFYLGNSRHDVYIILNLDQSAIGKYLEKNYRSFDHIYIVDERHNNVSNLIAGEDAGESTDDRRISETLLALLDEEDVLCRDVVYQGEAYLGTYTKVVENGWYICSLKSRDSLLSNLNALRDFIVVALLAAGMISVLAIIFMAYSITNPIARLVEIMNQVGRRKFDVRFEYPYRDEVGDLARNFNYMVERIDQLVYELNIHIEALQKEKEKVKEVQEQKRIAELKALQAQINPHFLYNTLNTITWEAASRGMDQISTISNSLGKFFRVSLSSGKEIIPLEDELEHAVSYLRIQQIRYDTKLQYEIDVPSDLYGIEVIKLILQPLIENAIYHGIKEKKENGRIAVAGKRQQNVLGTEVLMLSVEDNGNGISEEKLDLINNHLMEGRTDSSSGYGIYNVNERIKLYYGEEYGLSLESRYGTGTRAVMILPVYVGR